jgi:hypothetical protein
VGTAVGALVGTCIGLVINFKIGEPPMSIMDWVKEGVGFVVEGYVGLLFDVSEGLSTFLESFLPTGWRAALTERSGPQDRDFTQEMKDKLLNIVRELNKEWTGLIDFFGDIWLAAGLPTFKDYNTKLLDINNTSEADIERIFTDVQNIDNNFAAAFSTSRDLFQTCNTDLKEQVNKINA